MSHIVDPQAVNRAVASLSVLAGRYGRAHAQRGAGAVQELHVLRLSYDALGVVLGVRTQNERTEMTHVLDSDDKLKCTQACPNEGHRT